MFLHTTSYVLCVETQTIFPTTGIPTAVEVLWGEFEELCNARGWTNDYRRSVKIGVEHTTIGRLRPCDKCGGRRGRPGGTFIGKTLAALGVPFEAVFVRRTSERAKCQCGRAV